MTDAEVATLLESLAEDVIHLPGLSRTKPHAFAEAKSELRGKMRKIASDLRGPSDRAKALAVSTITTGYRTSTTGRGFEVVTRARRS